MNNFLIEKKNKKEVDTNRKLTFKTTEKQENGENNIYQREQKKK